MLIAAACFALSAAQRTLSTPVRTLRRRSARVGGRIVYRDGSEEAIDEASLRSVPEAALRAIAAGVSLLAAGAVVARLAG